MPAFETIASMSSNAGPRHGHQPLHVGLAADVTGDSRAVDFGCCRADGIRVDIRQNHLPAKMGKVTGHGSPDAACRAGHDHSTPIRLCRHRPSTI